MIPHLDNALEGELLHSKNSINNCLMILHLDNALEGELLHSKNSINESLMIPHLDDALEGELLHSKNSINNCLMIPRGRCIGERAAAINNCLDETHFSLYCVISYGNRPLK